MKHKIEIVPNNAIYIDGERTIGSKPYGLFLTTTMIVSDDDLKRLANRCLAVIADRKTEPQRSGTPYEIETSSVCKTEPQTSCKTCRYGEVDEGYVRCAYYSKSTEQDEPQTDCYVSDLCKHYGDKQICGRCRSRNLFCEAEPQPRCPKCGKRGYIRSLESMGVKLKVFDEYKWKCTNCNKYFKEEPKDEPQTDSLVIKKDTIPKEKLTHKDCGSCKFHDWEWDDFIGFRNICNASDTDTCPTPKYEPQFDKDINVRSKDEPQTDIHDLTDCDFCKDRNCKDCEGGKDEPQTDTEIAKEIVHKMIDDAVIAEDAYPDLRQKMHDAVDEYEPQTERSE